ncbi:MAG: MlaD family protein [Bacteroidia bacterium]|nr:MlaD family protein [Bacteroidia bacterium]MDW8302087.1 MlaD family protein [Bacteroidia bacterium]
MKISTEVKAGVLAALTLALLFATVNYLKGHTFSHTHKFYALFDKVGGIQQGTKVLWNGMVVGRVNRISVTPEYKIRVDFEVDDDVPVPKGSKVSIQGDAFFGASKLVIVPSQDKNLAQSGEELTGVVQEDIMKRLSNTFEPLSQKLEHTITSIDTLVSKLNRVLDHQNQARIEDILQNLKQTTASLNAATQKINDATSKEQLQGILKKIESSITNLEQNNQNITKIMANTAIATDTLKTTLSKINTNLLLSQKTLEKINSEQGTVGKLLNDKQLYENLSHSARDLDSLLIDLKANPKRYVHFSLIGRKDKDKKTRK